MSLGGIPLATRIAALLSRLFEEVLLVGGSPPEDAPGRRVSALCHDGAIVDHLAADFPYGHGVQERNDVRA